MDPSIPPKARAALAGHSSEGEARELRRVTWIGAAVNILLAAAKIAAGYFGNSAAVIADGVHTLSDLASDALLLVGVGYWTKKPDTKHPHGHYEIETITTLALGLMLGAAGFSILWDTMHNLRAHAGDAPPPDWIAFAAACGSIAVKEWLYQWTFSRGRGVRSQPMMANAWHHRSDAISSIPVAAAVGVAMFAPGWWFLDDVGGAVVAVIIIYTAGSIVFPALGLLAGKGASRKTVERIESIVLGTPGVLSFHKLRTIFRGCTKLSVDMHIQVDPSMTVRDAHEVCDHVERNLSASGMDIVDVVVHVEPFESPGDAADAVDGPWTEKKGGVAR